MTPPSNFLVYSECDLGMPQRKCCIHSCSSTLTEEASMHMFPHPHMFPDTFQAWVSLLGGKLDTECDHKLYRRKVVCDIHFTDKDRNRYNRLNCLAVPTLFVPNNSVEQNKERPTKDPLNDIPMNTFNNKIDDQSSTVKLSDEPSTSKGSLPDNSIEEYEIIEDPLIASSLNTFNKLDQPSVPKRSLPAMDLRKLIIHPEQMNETCFLCYKNSDTMTNLYDVHEIHDGYFDFSLSLWNIMKELFPTVDCVLNQACIECANLLIKMFLLLQRKHWNDKLLTYLTNNINHKLDEDIYKQKNTIIKVDLPTFEDLEMKEESEMVHKCCECEMKFTTMDLLKKHVKFSHYNPNEAIICDVCGKIFEKSAALKAHLKCHKEKQCPYCFKSLKSHSHYNVHLKNHIEPNRRVRSKKYYNCDNCVYKTLCKTSLEAHMNKIHLNIRPYTCKMCPKGFYKKSNLLEHFLTHNNVNKVCDVCGDSFVNDKTLKEHLRWHVGQKMYECGMCSATFINSGRRHEHIARKHREKKEICSVCSKKFSLKKDLNSHIKNVHRGSKLNRDYVIDVNYVQAELEVFDK